MGVVGLRETRQNGQDWRPLVESSLWQTQGGEVQVTSCLPDTHMTHWEGRGGDIVLGCMLGH